MLSVKEKKNFEVGFLCSYVPTCDQLVTPGVGPVLTPRASYKQNLAEIHKEILNTKYQSSMPSSSSEKNFEDEILCSYVPTCDTTPHLGGANLDHRSII